MAEVNYLDFDLLIERLGESSYRARVLASPAGQAVTSVTLPFSDLELENFLLKVGRTRRGVRRLESPEMEAAKVFGGKLFKSVFDGELMSCFRNSLEEAKKQRQGLRIRLRLNDAPELVNLPWEYLYNPSLNRFLSLSVTTPLVRYLELPERISPLAVTLPLRVLAVISSPSDYPPLEVEREWNNLKSALAGLEQRGLLVLDRLETASPVALQYSIRRREYHVFHFIGHGGFNEQAQDGLLMFEDENQRGRPLSGQYLGTILHDEQTLRLAVLNACEGARSGNTDPFAGVAQSLVQQGLPAVIAMQFEVTDEAAITFAREFYTSIGEGYPVDAALAEARKAIFSLGNDIEWGTPVLYMRAPDGQVFDISQASGIGRASPVPAEAEPVRSAVLPQETANRLEQLYTDGLSAYWLKDWGKAWECFRQVVEINPNYEDAAERLKSVKRQLTQTTLSNDADRFIQEGDWTDAQDALKRLIAQDPTYKDASARLEQVNKNIQLADLYDQARQLHKSQHWAAVLNVFAQIQALQPGYPDPDGLLESARGESARSEQQERLQGLYRQALKAMDGSRWMEAQGLLMQVQQIQADYNDTPRLLERVRSEIDAETSQRQRQGLVRAAYQRAGEQLRSRQWRKALEAMDSVRKLDPYFVDTLGIATAAQKGLDLDEAEARQKDALAAEYSEAMHLLNAGEPARALEVWEGLNAHSPGYPDPQNVQSRARKLLDATPAALPQAAVKPPRSRRSLIIGGVVLLTLLFAAFIISRIGPTPAPTPEPYPTQFLAPTQAPAMALTEVPAAAPTEAPAAPPTQAPAAAPTEAPSGQPAAGPGVVELGGVEYLTAYQGTTVTVFGVVTDLQAQLFQSEFDEFTQATGITVQYEGDRDFETQISSRVESGNVPDIATFPQPGLLADFVRRGAIIDPSTFLSTDFLRSKYSQGQIDSSIVDGKIAGVWHNADVKSLVWYPKAAFESWGYQIPQTWDELIALSDQILANGGTPWCIGIESGAATGWVGTDWVEDVMLRTTSPENYDAWTRGELKFNSPEVRRAFDTVGEIWFKDGYVYGGVPSILTTGFGDAVKPMFENPPNCWLHRQAGFISAFFPETAVMGTDIDYFYLPPIDPAQGKPVLGSGSIAAMFNDRPEVREVMKFLATGYSMKKEAEAGVAVAPQLDADPSWYPNDAARGFAKILQEATVFRFDGSDLMPGAVGAGSFWRGIVDWASAYGQNTDAVLQSIDDSWPAQ